MAPQSPTWSAWLSRPVARAESAMHAWQRHAPWSRQAFSPGALVNYAGIGIAYVIAYVILDRISYFQAWSIFGFTLWNPPPALSLALVIARGPAYIPWLFVAALVSDNLVRGALLGPATSIASALVLALSYGTLAMAIRKIGRIDLLRGQMRDLVLILVLIPAGVLVVAGCYVAVFMTTGFVRPADSIRAVTSFWVGDVTGILALLPCLLLLTSRTGSWREHMRGALLDFLIFAVALGAALWMIFVAGFVNELRFFYLLFIPVIWIAIRRGVIGAAIGVLAIEASVVGAVLLRGYSSDTFLAFQMFFLFVCATGLLLGAAVTARDYSQRLLRRQQAEVDRVARMTSIGVMGTALAHEISQPLASIATYAQACHLRLNADPIPIDRVRQQLDGIIGQTERAGQVLRQLRDFVAEGRLQPRPIDLIAVVRRVCDMFARDTAVTGVAVVIQPVPIQAIVADPVQIEQVFLNLIGNAVDATVQHRPEGGMVLVEIRATRGAVEVAIEDQGAGVDPDLSDQIFEPFVTSKSTGMGLGLTICRTIMEAHDGEILHENVANGGARFIVRLPLSRADR